MLKSLMLEKASKMIPDTSKMTSRQVVLQKLIKRMVSVQFVHLVLLFSESKAKSSDKFFSPKKDIKKHQGLKDERDEFRSEIKPVF